MARPWRWDSLVLSNRRNVLTRAEIRDWHGIVFGEFVPFCPILSHFFEAACQDLGGRSTWVLGLAPVVGLALLLGLAPEALRFRPVRGWGGTGRDRAVRSTLVPGLAPLLGFTPLLGLALDLGLAPLLGLAPQAL